MVSISDFETWEDYVRYRETNGYTDEELGTLLAVLESGDDHDFELF